MIKKLKIFSKKDLLLFLIIFLSSLFFSEFRTQTSNFSSRYFLTEAIVDFQTFKLDRFRDHLGIDKAFYKGHYFSDKPPGSSLLMIPQYFILVKPVGFFLKDSLPKRSLNNFLIWLLQISSLSVYSGMGIVFLKKIFDFFSFKNSFVFALISYFGTLMFPFSTIGVGEMFVAPIIIIASYLLLKNKLFLSGGFFAVAFLTSYQSLLIYFTALIYLVFKKRSKNFVFFIIPVVFALFFIGSYNWINFDNPFSFSSFYWAEGDNPALSFEWPSVNKIYQMLFSPWKGIFFFSPLFFLSIRGFIKMKKNFLTEVVFVVSAIFFYFIYFLFCSGWSGGADFGFRYFVPVIPFICLGAGYGLDKIFSFKERILVFLSVFQSLMAGITDPHVPMRYRFPLLEYNLPLFFRTAGDNILNHFFLKYFNLDVWLVRFGTIGLFFILMFLFIKIVLKNDTTQKETVTI